jgi:hypothetical protein
MVKAFLLCKNGLRPPPFLGGAHKKLSKTFNKNPFKEKSFEWIF